MENKKIYKSGELYGLYRCKRREEFAKKIPKIEKHEMPDVTGIILSGIVNFGNDPELIRSMAKEVIGCSEEEVRIPYNEMYSAKTQFIRKIITSKLTRTNLFSVESLMSTFYEFIETPTEMTRQLQVNSDIRDIKRYLNCESRTPIVIGNPIINLCGAPFSCQLDFLFKTIEKVKLNKRKEGRKYVYDEMEMNVVESVRLFPGKPAIKESSKILDVGAMSRLELYIMLKISEKWCRLNGITENVILKASYYYLQKDRETDENYSDNFFNKGGNVVSIQVKIDDIKKIDDIFEPQLKEFINGMSVSPDNCKNCSSRVFCEHKEITVPLTEDEKPLPKSLPVLSADQNIAANAIEGNVRVIATAGSGKTTTKAYRIMNLLKNGVAPEKIGCFTFTNAGAAEMKDRIKGFCKIAGIDADVDKITISTLHSFGDSLIKKYYNILGYHKQPVLINEIQKTKIIEKILSNNKPIDEMTDKYKNFYLDMFNAKGILETMKDFFNQLLDGTSSEEFKKRNHLSDNAASEILNMYMEYCTYKKNACLIEHSDQELGVLRLLKLKPDLFEEIGIEHISIDEYQDTSNIQFHIINAMRKAKCVKSLFIVGDDDQSIYGFRDANVELIKDFFEMIEEDGLDVHLMENRRSTGHIVNFASDIISNNEERIAKSPVSTNEKGKPVLVSVFNDKNEEQEFIVNKVTELIKDGVPENSIAILAPTNSELLAYSELLNKSGIDTISINPEPVLENTRVLAAIALVKFLMSYNEFYGTVYLNARAHGNLILSTKETVEESVNVIYENIKTIKSVSDLFEYFSMLDTKEEDEIYQSFLDDIRTAKEDDVKKENLKAVCEYIIDYERFGKKETARREKAYNGVVLSTMHSSKGKEWPVVFCSVSKLHGRNLKQEDIPEKNRLLFVACTRAKKELYVTGIRAAYTSTNAVDGYVENLFLQECQEAAAKQ